jgi:hypothetical protein
MVTLLAIATFVLVEEPAREMIRHFFGMRSSAGAEILQRTATAGSEVDRFEIRAQPQGRASGRGRCRRCPPRSGAVRREPGIAARSVRRMKRRGAIELRLGDR